MVVMEYKLLLSKRNRENTSITGETLGNAENFIFIRVWQLCMFAADLVINRSPAQVNKTHVKPYRASQRDPTAGCREVS